MYAEVQSNQLTYHGHVLRLEWMDAPAQPGPCASTTKSATDSKRRMLLNTAAAHVKSFAGGFLAALTDRIERNVAARVASGGTKAASM